MRRRRPSGRACFGGRELKLGRWTGRVVAFRSDTYALFLAGKDPRVPWPAKAVLVLVILYVLSPIDLVPDTFLGIGYLDDLIVIPLGFALATRLIPREIMALHRAEAGQRLARGKPRLWRGCLLVLAIWLLVTALFFFVSIQLVSKRP